MTRLHTLTLTIAIAITLSACASGIDAVSVAALVYRVLVGLISLAAILYTLTHIK